MESPLHEVARDGLKVIETFGFTPSAGFARLGLHMDRAEVTCARLQFPFDRGLALQTVGEAVSDMPARVRMTVDNLGDIAVTSGELGLVRKEWRVGVAEQRLRSNDPWLKIKTTERYLYNSVRSALPDGIDEMIFLNERNEVCEGTITNIFVGQDGVLVTPPLSSGLLPGVLRQELLESGEAVEGMLNLYDLKEGFYMGNSLRGLIKARMFQ